MSTVETSANTLVGDDGVNPQPNDFLTFLHLSDIHFRHRQGSEQFDLEAQLRRPLIDDIKSCPADGAKYDGLFITGDIAFSGVKEEYESAKIFLETLHANDFVLPERTYVVPGNHDVNRKMVVPNGAIWNNHTHLRGIANKVLRRDALMTQLTHDPACDPLAPLEKYNEFAQRYGCLTKKDHLAWFQPFPLKLNDGCTLRIHGLNSALNSDEDDEVGKLYVSPFQTQHFARDAGTVDLVLCHHPPHWLIDKPDIEGIFTAFARVALFGHEHTHRTQRIENSVHLYAGAVHPAARDPDWLPTYHILRLKVAETGNSRKLIVRVHSRELRAADHIFVCRNSIDGNAFEERIIDLPDWRRSPETLSSKMCDIAVTSEEKNRVEMPKPDSPNDDESFVSIRELLVYFHRLSTPIKYIIATKLELLRDGDDLPPQKQWDLVFERAIKEKKLGELWKAVAEHDAQFATRQNPFLKT